MANSRGKEYSHRDHTFKSDGLNKNSTLVVCFIRRLPFVLRHTLYRKLAAVTFIKKCTICFTKDMGSTLFWKYSPKLGDTQNCYCSFGLKVSLQFSQLFPLLLKNQHTQFSKYKAIKGRYTNKK